VVAALIGVPSDEVYRRAERDRRRWTRIRNGVIAALAILALFSTASALYARHQLKTNEAFLDATLERFTHLVNRAVALGESYSVPVAVSLGFLEEAEGMLQVVSEYGRPTSKLKYRRAIMLRAFADDYRVLGRTSEWERRSLEAKAIMTDLVALEPGNDEWASELALAHERYGDLLAAKGRLPDALAEYTSYVQLMKRLVEKDPAASWRQRDLSVSYAKVGEVLVAQGNLADALKSFRDSHAITDRLAKADPGNAGW
jgi:tetratricopeptide (TPR) repeat protein